MTVGFFFAYKKFNSFFHDCVICDCVVRMWICVSVPVNPNKSPYKLHDNLLWTFSNLTRCIFHLMVLTENSSCVELGFVVVVVVVCAIALALYLQSWSHIAVCRRYISRSDLFCRLFFGTLFVSFSSHTGTGHTNTHVHDSFTLHRSLFSVSGFRHNKKRFKEVCFFVRCAGSSAHCWPFTFLYGLCWSWQRCMPMLSMPHEHFHLQSSFAEKQKFTYNWIPETHENINNLLKLIANVS